MIQHHVYHHVFEKPARDSFVLNEGAHCFFLHYTRRGALQLKYGQLNNQLLPEEHFQVYYISDPHQEFEFKQSGKFSLLSISFNEDWLVPLKNYSRTMSGFLQIAANKQPAALFTRPQPLTVENKRLLNDIFSDTWSAQHTKLMLRLILLPALKRSALVIDAPLATNDPIYAVTEWILLHLDEPVSIPFLAQKFLINEFKLKSEFKKIFGVPVISFQRKARIEKAKQMLAEQDVTIAEVGRAIGFSSTPYFSDFFRRETNETPSDYRKKFRESV